MCLMCSPTVFPLTKEVTRRLLSQWPPLKSNFPSWETTNNAAVTSTPGAKGLDRKRWVLHEDGEKTAHTERRVGKRTQNNIRNFACVLFSLSVGHCGVFNESEVVGDVLVVREPPMGPNQAVLTNCHLYRVKQYYIQYINSAKIQTSFHDNQHKCNQSLGILCNLHISFTNHNHASRVILSQTSFK